MRFLCCSLLPSSACDEIQTNREEPLLLGHIAFFFIFIMTASEKHSIFELLVPILDIDGIELVDVETQLKTLRLLIHKPGGLSVSDCQAVDRLVRPILEVHEYFESYTRLESRFTGLRQALADSCRLSAELWSCSSDRSCFGRR